MKTKTRTNKLISILLALVVMLGLFTVMPVTTSAAPTKLAAPTGLNAKYITSSSVFLFWNQVEEADGYYVYVKDGQGNYHYTADILNVTGYCIPLGFSNANYALTVVAYKQSGAARTTSPSSMAVRWRKQ